MKEQIIQPNNVDMSQEMAQPSPEINPDALAASLAFATKLGQDTFFPQQMMEMGDSDDMDIEAQNEADKAEEKEREKEDKTDEKLEILRTELKETIKMEIDSIKQMIKDALSEENEKD
jgi:hypothetical protein